jgi:transposase
VWEGAKESVGCALNEAVRWEAPQVVKRLRALRDELRETEDRMVQSSRRLPGYTSVISVPGIGPAVAAMTLAALGDPHRFEHPRQVLRTAGLDLCASRSGKTSERVVPRISKQGKPMLRYALVQGARVAARSSEPVRAYFTKLLEGREQERGIRGKRTVKLASKLLVVAWTLMKKGEVFDPTKFTH